MTTVYWVRHALPDFENRDDLLRELSEQGRRDSERVTAYLVDKKIDIVLSSPCLRTVQTVKPFVDQNRITVQLVEDFREREVGGWLDNFQEYAIRQWQDFTYQLPQGESLAQVQRRNIGALNRVLQTYRDKNIVIGTHGTALSTVIHFYDCSFGYEQFLRLKMPHIVKMCFQEKTLQNYQLIDIL